MIVAIVADWPTVWVIASEVEPLKSALPENTAVIEWPPTDRVAVSTDATPALTGAVPRLVTPSKNSTEPTGVAADGATADTVAENVTS